MKSHKRRMISREREAISLTSIKGCVILAMCRNSIECPILLNIRCALDQNGVILLGVNMGNNND